LFLLLLGRFTSKDKAGLQDRKLRIVRWKNLDYMPTYDLHYYSRVKAKQDQLGAIFEISGLHYEHASRSHSSESASPLDCVSYITSSVAISVGLCANN